jgi:putative transposase
MRRVRKSAPPHQPAATPPVQTEAALDDGTMMLSMIQALIPLGLAAVEEALQHEVTTLAGARYARGDGTAGIARWGAQRGSVFLADQKVPVTVPRVRDLRTNTERPLATYAALQTPRARDVGLFRRVLSGMSTRDYHAAAEALPEAFGLAKSSVSRRFVRASAQALQQLHTRRHDDREWLVLLLDGKAFADDGIVIALGVTTTGEKRILGLVQTATENKRVCATFLRDLVERGFTAPRGLLVVLDGAKGLRAAVRDVFGDDVAVQRCQWHKRQNVLSYLTKPQQVVWRRKLIAAYAHAGYDDAKRALQRLVKELEPINASAARSMEEGLDETLTLHRLRIPEELRKSLNTTNLIESVMACLERHTRRITHWRTSDQKQRWVAATLLKVEVQFRRVRGMTHLPLLQKALGSKLHAPTVAA